MAKAGTGFQSLAACGNVNRHNGNYSMLRLSGICSLVLLLGVAWGYWQDTRFWHRYLSLISHGGVPSPEWYQPQYPVASGRHEFWLPTQYTTVSEDVLNDVTEYARRYRSSSLLIWHKGQLQRAAYFGDTRADTALASKSMAKMIVGIVIGRAIRDGYIAGLDQSAATYISEWQGTPKEAITLRHLLHMAPGFETFYTMNMNPFDKFIRSYLSSYHEQVIINEYPMVDKPGTRFDYSQVTSDLLAVVLKRATGKAYGDYLSESLIQPLGALGGTVWMNRTGGLAHTGCCLMLPAETWLRIGVFLLAAGVVNDQPLLPSGWMAEYLAASPGNPALGLHIWLGKPYFERRAVNISGDGSGGSISVWHSEPYAADDLFLFDGNSSQVLFIVPSEQLVVLRTGSSPLPINGVEWDNTYIVNRLIRSVRVLR